MKKILFPFRSSNLKVVLKHPANNPKEFMYGMYELKKKKIFDIDFFHEPRTKGTLKRSLVWLIEQPFVKVVRLGLPLGVYLFHNEKYKNVDTIVCINDALSFSILFWKFFGFIDSDVVTLFQSLPERHRKHFKNNILIIWFIRKLLSGSNKILVLSSNAKYELSKVFKIPLEKIDVFYFGADLTFWSFKKFNFDERDYILSVGNDINRDYETLCKAVSDKYKTIIVTSKKISCDGVEIKSKLTNKELLELYHGARLIITPSIYIKTESSGLSSTVQAMACGTPVLISDSPSMRDLFEENQEIFYFEPENKESLEKKLTELWGNKKLLERISKNGKIKINKTLNSENMAIQLHKILE
ncbi:glycosyltransferase [Candidatus Pseudothioglobus singularis]|jgi:glycosyltransferase involved in cell wall biosynthesis|nr:glycosyltransferase [Candidatus Pseudothioglobus singularis]